MSETPSSYTAFGLRAEAEPIRPGLHVVATPIGNLGDISFRALATLAAANLVVAEDTRVTKTLLAHYGITTPLFAYHEHNADAVRPQLLARLEAGQALALVSDAGTPLVSDPGFRLVGEALARDVAVTSVPGPSAVLAGLVVAGLPTSRFFFEGFLPPKSAARRQRIAAIATVPGTLVIFESSRRLTETMEDLAAVLGPREAAVARELTKMFEAVKRGTLPRARRRDGGVRSAARRDRGCWSGRRRTRRRRSTARRSTPACAPRWRATPSRMPPPWSRGRRGSRAARSTHGRSS